MMYKAPEPYGGDTTMFKHKVNIKWNDINWLAKAMS